jgi:nucleoside 2-deoxyribosyltransferase
VTRVYLAGPDVFLPDPEGWLARKKAICAAHGLIGVSPLDALPEEPVHWADLPPWRQIAVRNEAHIRGCLAMLANLTPFRGPSADAGTVYEVGFARGLGLKVFGYASGTASFLERCRSLPGAAADGRDWRDGEGMLVESFGLYDNLMIEAGICDSGWGLLVGEGDRWRDLALFERCVLRAANVLARSI